MIALSQRRCNPHRHIRSRPAYNFARGGSLWLPKERRLECGGVSMAFSPAFADFGSGDSPLEWPGASSLLAWYHWRFDRQYNTTLATAGTGIHPNVTWTGTVPVGLGLRVEITTGGARGTAIFRWSGDNGTNWTSGVTTAATVSLGNGVTLVFQSATYLTTNVYILTVSSFRDQTGNGFHLNSAGNPAECPFPLVTPYGTGVSCDGVNDFLQDQTTLADALVGGTDNDFCCFIIARIENTSPTSGNGAVLFLGNSANNRSFAFYFTTTPNWLMRKWDDVPAAVNVSGGTPDTAIHIQEVVQDGTTAQLLLDGTSIVGPTSQNLGSVTGLDNATIGASFLSGARSSFGAITYFEMGLYASSLDATTRADLRARYRAPYGF